MAIVAVAVFVLVSYTVLVNGEPGPTPGDTTAIEIAEKLRTDWLIHVAKVFTHLGSSALTGALAFVAAVLLIARRRWAELGVLLGGVVLIFAGVHEIKDAVDRPRPGGGLIGVSGSSFPSAHAAYSTFYVWLAVTIVLPLALQKIENEYLLFGAAGLVSLVAFVGLILVPALSSYGRVWEKTAAGVLSLFVLAALVLVGVVAGLAIVYYYNDIVNFLHGH